MSTTNREQSLESARNAAHFLALYIESQIETPHVREEIACLLAEFKRLDEKEQKQIKAGRKFGKLGGRPKGS